MDESKTIVERGHYRLCYIRNELKYMIPYVSFMDAFRQMWTWLEEGFQSWVESGRFERCSAN